MPLLIALIIGLNILIYYRAVFTIEPPNTIFAECARNSGRTSAALNLILLFMLGHFGLKKIYREHFKKKVFRTLTVLFAVNHLIHFFFVSRNFNFHARKLTISDNMHGFITYICLILLPVILYSFKYLNKVLYILIIAHFFNITYLISETFYARYKPVDPAYLHRLGVLIMIAACLYILYRAYKERSIKFIEDKNRDIEKE